MAMPGPPRPNIPPRNAKANNSSYQNALRSSINTGDLDKSWGKFLLKKAKETENTVTVSPSTSSPKDKDRDNNKKVISNTGADVNINISTGEQWLTPNNTVRTRKRQLISPTNVNNTFQSLSEIDSDPDDEQTSHATQIFKKPKNNPRQTAKPTSKATPPPNPTKRQLNFNVNKNKSGFTAVIEIWDTPLRDIVKLLLDGQLARDDFVIRTKSTNRMIINPSTPDSLLKIKKALEPLPNWYTYTPQKEKPKNLVLKKVTDFTEAEVKNHIDSLNIPNVSVIKVIKYIYNKSTPENFHLIVQITHDSLAKNLMSVNSICYQRATWDWFRRNKVFQCKRCQRVGHASINCHFTRRCIKCGEPHGKDDCPIEQNSDKNLLKCVNCNKSGHPASYFGCEYLKFAQSKYMEQRSINKNNFTNKTKPSRPPSRKTTPSVSFADIAKPQRFPQLKGQHSLPDVNPAPSHNYNHQFNQPGPYQNNPNIQAQLHEIFTAIKQQHSSLMMLIAENASRIDYLFNHFEC